MFIYFMTCWDLIKKRTWLSSSSSEQRHYILLHYVILQERHISTTVTWSRCNVLHPTRLLTNEPNGYVGARSVPPESSPGRSPAVGPGLRIMRFQLSCTGSSLPTRGQCQCIRWSIYSCWPPPPNCSDSHGHTLCSGVPMSSPSHLYNRNTALHSSGLMAMNS